ncbi:MAG: invasion associated locus B family protein [Rhodobacteraceae bacterium]|nr:invasion associated locus B family protein [Paracoccaceae bacterium]
MRAISKALTTVAVLSALTLPALAQDGTTDQPAPAQQAAPAQQPAPAPAPQQAAPRQIAGSRADAQPRQPYRVGTFSDWLVQCIRVDEAPNDPCQMNQTLKSPDGSPTAEVNLFRLDREGVEAGATIVTPLETLLTRNIALSVDGTDPKSYPFTFCSRQGCIAQVGFKPEEIAAFKKGETATITIYPMTSPNQPVQLSLSLAGFTAAYDSLTGIPGIP